MKLYTQLQLHADQRAVMAERWRSWCRRRHGLDLQLASALHELQVLTFLSMQACDALAGHMDS